MLKVDFPEADFGGVRGFHLRVIHPIVQVDLESADASAEDFLVQARRRSDPGKSGHARQTASHRMVNRRRGQFGENRGNRKLCYFNSIRVF